MEWTKAIVEECYKRIEIARDVETGLHQAKLDKIVSPDTSENALRKAAARHGYVTPRNFLKGLSVESEAVMEPIVDDALASVLMNSKISRKTEQYWKMKATEAATTVDALLRTKLLMSPNVEVAGMSPVKGAADEIEVTRIASDDSLRVYNGSMISFISADIHVGKFFEDTDNRKFVSFNKQVAEWFESQMHNYMHRVASRLPKNPAKILYAALGDNFESFLGNMRHGQHLTMEAFSLDQYKLLVKFHKRILMTLRTLYPNIPITAVFVPGNHDRIMESKDWDSEYILNYFLTERIAGDFESDKLMNFVAAKRVASVKTPFNTEILLHHGHLSNVKTEDDLVNFTRVHGDKNSTRYVVCQGHLHHFRAMQAAGDTLGVWAPSFVSADDFTLYKLNKNSAPGMLVIEHTEDYDALIGPFSFKK